mmetsp:Transcript_15997/g.40130  ORF Transcript_15997/g.40130 Transcript_15997/m.40130 type:complete len:135 (+) Transcript_15997:2283-2687(+)
MVISLVSNVVVVVVVIGLRKKAARSMHTGMMQIARAHTDIYRIYTPSSPAYQLLHSHSAHCLKNPALLVAPNGFRVVVRHPQHQEENRRSSETLKKIFFTNRIVYDIVLSCQFSDVTIVKVEANYTIFMNNNSK